MFKIDIMQILPFYMIFYYIFLVLVKTYYDISKATLLKYRLDGITFCIDVYKKKKKNVVIKLEVPLHL